MNYFLGTTGINFRTPAFILYMNDLQLHLSGTQIDLYADDASQYVCGSNIQVVEEKLTREILPIIQWSEMNKMVLNEKKTKAMVVASSRKLSALSSIDNGSLIEPVTHERVLGIHLDQSLNWTLHADVLCKKISQCLGILRRIRHHLSLSARLAYYASGAFSDGLLLCDLG